jgi:hypothetical protein
MARGMIVPYPNHANDVWMRDPEDTLRSWLDNISWGGKRWMAVLDDSFMRERIASRISGRIR